MRRYWYIVDTPYVIINFPIVIIFITSGQGASTSKTTNLVCLHGESEFIDTYTYK